MTLSHEDTSVPVFEIDQPENYGQYLLTNPREILRHLQTLQAQRSFITLYLDEGRDFFLSTILAVDEEKQRISLDTPGKPELLKKAYAAKKVTLSTTVDRIKIQLRLQFQEPKPDERPEFICPLPTSMLRLQRREFFRIETPRIDPLRCKLARHCDDGRTELFDFPLYDLSGGGLCMIGNIKLGDDFRLGELFSDCRLEIPGESVISVNLRLKEISRVETLSGEPQLRLGCEFVNLPGTRLSLIERYITRLERERKAKETGGG